MLPWSIIFPLVCWCNWLNRNKSLLRSSSPANPMDHKFFSHLDILARATEWFFTVHSTKKVSRSSEISVGWEPPPLGTLLINTDGAVDRLGNAAAG